MGNFSGNDGSLYTISSSKEERRHVRDRLARYKVFLSVPNGPLTVGGSRRHPDAEEKYPINLRLVAMVIQRAGETPPFVELPLRFVVVDSTLGVPPLAVAALNPTQVTIPSFQRGIEWGSHEVEELLNSSAVLYGTVILGSFPGSPQVLIDGLQRFATTTALLYCLHGPVLQPNPTQQAAAPYFLRLRARVAYYHPIIEFNINALSSHKRQAIRNSFLRLLLEVDALVQAELVPGRAQAFATHVETMLLDRQVAIDPYFNFSNVSQMTGTFVNLNTAGLELSPIDIVRSRIVDQASVVGWPSATVARMEDRFTDVFENAGPRTHSRALAKAIEEVISEPATVGCLFPNWTNLSAVDVDEFLRFVDASLTAGQMGASGYFREIFQCSPAVFALATLYYYRETLQVGSDPGFIPNGTRGVDGDLHLLLRSVYRRVLDGTVFRIGDMIQGIIGSSVLPPMNKVSDGINAQNSCGPMGSPVSSGWLSQRLSEVEGSAARRVFNACILPPRTLRGGNFTPLDFGRRALQMTLDHLIPSSTIRQNVAGESSAETILNLAPLLMQFNRIASSTPCSTKLAPNQIYQRQLPQLSNPHPYLTWLLSVHYPAHSTNPGELDDQTSLVPGNPNSIGDERVAELTRILLPIL